MDIKTIPAVIVGVMVALVMVGATMPIWADTLATEDTFTNDTGTLWRMKELKAGDTWTYTGATQTWTYNDVVQDGVIASGWNALLGPDWCLRSNGQIRGTSIAGNLYNTILAVTSDDTITFTAQGLNGNGTQSIPGYGVYTNGDYVLTDYSSMGAYVNGDTEIFGTGVTGVDGVDMICHISATVDDGVTFTISDNRNGQHITDIVLTNTKVNYTTVDNYNDLYKVTSITTDIAFNATDSENVTTAHTGTITYSSVVVPYEVVGERSVSMSGALGALVSIIPLLIIAGLVIGAVTWFMLRKG